MFVLNKHIKSKVFEDTIFDINLHELKTKFLEGNVLTTIYFPSQVSIDGCFKKLLKNSDNCIYLESKEKNIIH